jgi:fucose permease
VQLSFFKKGFWYAFFYVKLCFGRTQDHIGFFMSLLDKFLLVLILFELKGKANPFALTCLFVVFFILFVGLGHLDLKKGLASKETSLRNEYNPEIRKILARVEK